MSAVVLSTRGEACGICLGDFAKDDLRFTHKGGEKHDPFHESCLQEWLKQNPICPIDRTPIDPRSLLSRVEVSRDRVILDASKAAVFKAIYSAEQSVRVRVGVAALGLMVEVGCLAGDSISVSPGWGGMCIVPLQSLCYSLEILGEARNVKFPVMTVMKAASILGSIAIAEKCILKGTRKEAALASVVAILDGGIRVINTARERKKINGTGVGFFVGGIASLMAAVSFKEKNAARFATFGLPLISGATAGIFSLLSRRVTAITNTL